MRLKKHNEQKLFCRENPAESKVAEKEPSKVGFQLSKVTKVKEDKIRKTIDIIIYRSI